MIVLKKIVLILLILSLLYFGGCQTNRLSLNQSNKNFMIYQTSIDEIATQYGFNLKEEFDENIENQKSYKDLRITISNHSEVYIRIINSAYNSNTGVESFTLQYSIDNSENSKEFFNTDLFVNLVNSISGKTISKDFCDEFLQAPEKKYPATKFGFEKLNEELIAKQIMLDRSENWTITYVLSSKNEEELTFGGLTKQLKD